MVVIGLALVRVRDLFGVVMLSGLFTLTAASLYLVMDAVDVAFTEAAVGAGISTVVMLGTLLLTTSEEKPQPLRVVPLLIVVITGATLVLATLDMPEYGDPQAPIHNHVAPRYIHRSADEIGVPNIVTSVLASYRGYDTLGETVVIFTAGVGVLLMIGGALRFREPAEQEGGKA